jgi:hypothetical protein
VDFFVSSHTHTHTTHIHTERRHIRSHLLPQVPQVQLLYRHFSAIMVRPAKRKASVLQPAAHKDESPAKKRNITLQAIVAQKLRDNFRRATPTETDCRQGPDGRTLRQRLEFDFGQAVEGNSDVVHGRLYYDMLRAIYITQSDVHAALKCPQESEGLAVDAKLMEGMQAAQKKQPDRRLCMSWLMRCEIVPNAKEIRGVLRLAVTLKAGCVKQLADAQILLQFAARLEVHICHEEAWSHCVVWTESVLLQLLKKSRGLKTPDQEWLRKFRAVCGLVFVKTDLDAVLDRTGEWKTVKTNLFNMTASSSLGRVLFDEQVREVLQMDVDEKIDLALKKAFGGKECSEASVRTAKLDLIKELEAMPSIDALPPREVKVRYRRHLSLVKISGLTDEVNVKFEAVLRGLAVEQKRLKTTFAEEVIIPESAACGYSAAVPDHLVHDCATARTALANLIKDNAINSADVLAKVVLSKASVLTLTDPMIKLELALFSDSTRGDACGTLQMRILDGLPAEGRIQTPEVCHQKLATLSQSELCRYSSRAAQEKLRLSQSLLKSFIEQRPPATKDLLEDSFMKDVLLSCGYFCVHRVAAAKMLYGAEAAKKEYDKLFASESQTLADVTKLRVFGWLLQPAQVKRLDEAAKKAAGAKKGAGKGTNIAAASSSSSSSAALKTKTKETQESDQWALKKAMCMFDD